MAWVDERGAGGRGIDFTVVDIAVARAVELPGLRVDYTPAEWRGRRRLRRRRRQRMV